MIRYTYFGWVVSAEFSQDRRICNIIYVKPNEQFTTAISYHILYKPIVGLYINNLTEFCHQCGSCNSRVSPINGLPTYDGMARQ